MNSNKAIWTGRILSAIPVGLLLFSGVVKLLQLPPVLQSFTQLGYPQSLAITIGLLEVGCALIYVIPRTSVIGAILLTGYLGGAIATHLRIGDPLLSHTLFPIYIGAMLWAGLFLREGRLRALVPLRLGAG